MKIIGKPNSFLKDTFITSLLGIVGKSVSFLMPFFIAAWFGVSRETDSFFFAYEIIFYILSIFSPVLENIIVPYIAEMQKKQAGEFIGSILCLGLIILGAITGALLIFASPIVGLLTNFSAEDIRLIHTLFAETAILLLFVVSSSTVAGILNAHRKFALPAVSPVFRAGISLTTIFLLKDRFGVHSLAIGYVLGDLVRLIVLYAYLRYSDLCRIRLNLRLTENVINFFKTAGFQIGAMSITGLYPFIDKTLASWLDEGSVSVLHYAYRLYLIPVTFFMTGLMVTALSYWSKEYNKYGATTLRTNVFKVSKFILPIAIVVSMILYAISGPLVNLAYAREGFTPELLNSIKWVVRCFLFGFFLDVTYHIFVRANICIKNTRAIMISSILMIVISLVFKLVAMKIWGVRGIALGFSICLLAPVVYLAFSFNKFCSNVQEETS